MRLHPGWIIALLVALPSACGGGGDSSGAIGDTIGDAGAETDGAGGGGAKGDPCLAQEDCAEGVCIPIEDHGVCSGPCTPGCWPRSGCCPDPPEHVPCGPCTLDLHCPEGACLEIDGELSCATSCDAGGGCAEGYACTAETESGSYCFPITGTCSCRPATDGALRPCEVSNADGTCEGTQTCVPTSGWTACSAPTPAAETCDGVDEDCDGETDEGLPEEAACENRVPGVGACAGVKICLGVSGWFCDAPAPVAESCDGTDNDCDGETDEDFRDAGGAWTLDAHCGGCGEDCAGAIPHGTGRCGGTAEQPACVVEGCDAGYEPAGDTECVAEPQASPCDPCTGDGDCGVGTCATLGGGDFCVMPCAGAEKSCAPGYLCQQVAGGPERCVPESGSCD